MNESDYQERIKKLEDDLARERTEKFFHKDNANALMMTLFPFVPPTPEEEEALRRNIDGKPIREIIAELEKELH